MKIAIERENGDIVTDHFRVGHASTMSSLRQIGKNSFKLLLHNDIYKTFDVAIIDDISAKFALRAYFKGDHVWYYTLEVESPKEGWKNWSEEEERQNLDLLVKIIASSGLTNPADLPWGHVQADIDMKSGFAALVVAYYKAQR